MKLFCIFAGSYDVISKLLFFSILTLVALVDQNHFAISADLKQNRDHLCEIILNFGQ